MPIPSRISCGRCDCSHTLLRAATTLVQLYLGVGMATIAATQPATAATMGRVTTVTVLAALFLCNFAGYVVLATALYLRALPKLQHVSRRALMVYAGLTVAAYFAIA